MVSAADEPCKLVGAKRSGLGWLSVKDKDTLMYLVSPINFDTGPKRVPWASNAQARYEALTGFSNYFREISAPEDKNSVLMVKGMQVKSVKCPEGLFISYELKLSNMSWGKPEMPISSKKDELPSHTDSTNTASPLVDVLPPTKPPSRNSGTKEIIEN